MTISNINGKPNLEILDDDPKFMARMVYGKTTVQISKPVWSDFHDEWEYHMFVNGNEIFGTGTNSLAAALTWAESYIMMGYQNPKERVLEHIREINRTLSTLEMCFENDAVKLK